MYTCLKRAQIKTAVSTSAYSVFDFSLGPGPSVSPGVGQGCVDHSADIGSGIPSRHYPYHPGKD